jgi:glutathione-regulated potassium-efflux system protein KefB
VLICVDDPTAADRIVELVRHEFPQAKLYVRAFDRGHALRLIAARVDYQVRETFESAMSFGGEVLRGLGFDEVVAAETMADVRRRDAERLELQVAGGLGAGRYLLRGNLATPEPAPLTRPQGDCRPLNAEAARALGSADSDRPTA